MARARRFAVPIIFLCCISCGGTAKEIVEPTDDAPVFSDDPIPTYDQAFVDDLPSGPTKAEKEYLKGVIQRTIAVESYVADNEEDVLEEGRGYCDDDIPSAIATHAPDDFLSTDYEDFVEHLGKMGDYLYDGDWKAKVELAATHLCPAKKPVLDAATLSARLNFDDGTYEIGEGEDKVLPGTYRIEESVDDCYWERTAHNGDIIDNQFASHATTIEVRIAPTDGSFESNDCGTWWKVG